MKLIEVVYFQRKPQAQSWSLEFIFNDVRGRLKDKINPTIKVAKYPTDRIFKLFYNMLEAPFKQGGINHITGDIHYVSFFLKKKKTILTIADCVFMESPSRVKKIIMKFIWLYIPSKRVQYITAISEFTKKTILKYLPSFPSDRIIVIPVAVSDHFTPQPKIFDKNCPNILLIGTNTNKNLWRLIEAVKNIKCRLTIIGRLGEDYIQKLAEYKIEYANYMGLTELEMVEKYKQADILSFVSTYEGFGMPIIEANRIGRAVITSNCASMPEVAGEAALLIDPFDIESIKAGLIRIITEDEYREDLIQKGFINARRFDGDLIANEYYSLYEKTLEINNY